ncbi:MAG: NUDIX hydrolase [Actinomycetota bacterium]
MASGSDGTWIVSCKGVVLADGQVLLAANDRGEWELPGGRLEAGETPAGCVAREVAEETGLAVEVTDLIDTWVYEPLPGREVLIVTYGCVPFDSVPSVIRSDEHLAVEFLAIDELDRLTIPEGYRASIRSWAKR